MGQVVFLPRPEIIYINTPFSLPRPKVIYIWAWLISAPNGVSGYKGGILTKLAKGRMKERRKRKVGFRSRQGFSDLKYLMI